MRAAQRAGYAQIDTWQELVEDVHDTLGGRHGGFFVMDDTHPERDPSYGIFIDVVDRSRTSNDMDANDIDSNDIDSSLVVQVSYLVPYHTCYQRQRRVLADGTVEHHPSRDKVTPALETALRIVERELAERYGYWRLDPELAATPVPGIYIDGHVGSDPPTLAEALFGPRR